jgi:hypothetical protein
MLYEFIQQLSIHHVYTRKNHTQRFTGGLMFFHFLPYFLIFLPIHPFPSLNGMLLHIRVSDFDIFLEIQYASCVFGLALKS